MTKGQSCFGTFSLWIRWESRVIHPSRSLSKTCVGCGLWGHLCPSKGTTRGHRGQELGFKEDMAGVQGLRGRGRQGPDEAGLISLLGTSTTDSKAFSLPPA